VQIRTNRSGGPLKRIDTSWKGNTIDGQWRRWGGIDTQNVLEHEGRDGVKEEERRAKKLLGPRLIVSPSHEALLPNVPPENVVAMAEAALE
jgi:uroporphyrinogen decarboxylase